MELIEQITCFGLTRQESTIYLTLQTDGELTGYEVAKLTGISRSNTYIALAGLVEKGAAYVMEENVSKYTPVPFEEFSSNVIRKLTETQGIIIKEMPSRRIETDGYITVRGEKNILDKLINMLIETKQRVYVSVPADILDLIEDNLQNLIKENKKVVILTNAACAMKGAIIYHKPKVDGQIRLIVDSQKVLTGQISNNEDSACLYSKNKNLVDIFKEMLENEITLIGLEH